MDDPKLAKLVGASPKLQRIMKEVEANPMAGLKYMGDPEVAPLLDKAMGSLMGGGSGGGKKPAGKGKKPDLGGLGDLLAGLGDLGGKKGAKAGKGNQADPLGGLGDLLKGLGDLGDGGKRGAGGDPEL